MTNTEGEEVRQGREEGHSGGTHEHVTHEILWGSVDLRSLGVISPESLESSVAHPPGPVIFWLRAGGKSVILDLNPSTAVVRLIFFSTCLIIQYKVTICLTLNK